MKSNPHVQVLGKKVRVGLEVAGKEIACPGCGKRSRVPVPKNLPAPAPPEEEEVKLQDLPPPPPPLSPSAAPMVLAVPEEEEDEAGYGLDAHDGLADLDKGAGMYGTFAVIRLDETASCLAYGCKGDWALAGQSGDVLIVNMKTKKRETLYDGHEAAVTGVSMSTTAPLGLSGDEDGELHFWDIPVGKRKKRIQAHEDAINAVAVSPDGALAASGGEDGQIKLWDLTTGKRRDLEHADWQEWDEEVTFVTFSRDGARLLAGGSGGRVSMWKVETGARVKRYAAAQLPISCVRLSDEGGKVTATTHAVRSGGLSYLQIFHWETKTGKPITHIELGVDSVPCCVAPDRGGARLLVGGGSGDPWLGIWSFESGRLLHAFDDLKGAPLYLAVAPQNNRVLAALDNERLQLFGLESN